jgi:hypothetical protein
MSERYRVQSGTPVVPPPSNPVRLEEVLQRLEAAEARITELERRAVGYLRPEVKHGRRK